MPDMMESLEEFFAEYIDAVRCGRDDVMGQYYIVANLDKRQFYRGPDSKMLEIEHSANGTAAALCLLTSAGNGLGMGDHPGHDLIGSWAGDRVVTAGDYSEPGRWLDCLPDLDSPVNLSTDVPVKVYARVSDWVVRNFEAQGLPGPVITWRIVAAVAGFAEGYQDPADVNLYHVCRDTPLFEDISGGVRGMLGAGDV